MPFVEAPGGALVHFIDLDLHAEALHTEVNDPVVLIHGLGCDWRHWSRQIGWIAHSRRVVVPDVRGGAGKTRWTHPGWTTADMAADVHAVVTELSLRRPAIAGISLGGTIALQYALEYPEDLSRLVVCASFAAIPDELAKSRDAQWAYIKSHTLREVGEERVGAAFTASADQDVRAWMVDIIAGGVKEGYESEAQTVLGGGYDVRSRLGEIHVPTWVIATLHVIKGEGHFANVPGPGEVQPVLRRRARNPTGPRPEAVTQLTVPELDRRFAGLRQV